MNNANAEKIITDCKDDLDQAIIILNGLGVTSNVIPYLNKYSIIRSCGAIEASFKTIISDFCNKRSKKQIKNYINEKIRDSSINPSYNNICKTLKCFDEKWSSDFKQQLNSHPEKLVIMDSLGSLIDARNEFAHGGNPTITLTDTRTYFEKSEIVISILDNIVA
jgi:hypothetical protein